jgi:glycosyltransferase involved in cell wall biosynthesis
MRVAHVIAGPYPAFRGSQVLVAELVDGLHARGHTACVVSYGTWLAERPGFHPGRVPLDVALLAKLWRRVRAGGIDLIHAHNYEAGGAALVVSRLTGVPFVFHGHSAMGDEMPLYARSARAARVLARIGGFLDDTVPRAAAACVAVTEELAAVLRRAGARRVACVPPLRKPDDETGTRACGEEEPAPTVVYAGNLDAYQNLGALWQAFDAVCARVPEARLVIVSHPDARRAAERLARTGVPAAVEFVFASSYEEVRSWLGRAHVLVVPRCEATGYPVKVLNYMAAGKAIVATAGSGKGLRDGETGRLVPDGDVAAFAQAVGDLLLDPGERRRLGAAARAAANDPRPYHEGLAALEQVYGEVVRR